MKMEDDLDSVPCSSLAVESSIRVATAGAIWGCCLGPYQANQRGLKGMDKALFVANATGKFGLKCGFIAGVFSVTRCGLRRHRGRQDWVNGFIAGGITGAAVAVASRNRSQVIGMATIVSVFCGAVDYARTA
ncbi:PREDICTED: outer envelope pore protein 16-4, chloroplastic-like [Lupinus angustifolius]|uniref:outer envelope pore protein 16-4, chloroplastic-like n=1 Tax=Lupinus angustifolius TaxID=3871 RepID=UPI00092E3593|nr:PREDICTED: outer envelope pore protein 16-4, chloroplastic-like [Lupinus angustifolius]